MFGTIRGIEINGKSLFFASDEDLEAHRIRKAKESKQKQLEGFKKNKSKLDQQYQSLPQVFKDRIDRFRSNNPNFRVEFEDYELFCCTEAVLIASKFKASDDVKKFYSLAYEEQKHSVPELSKDHSGNTFGCACKLAMLYLEQPENVPKLHGSLSALVGSEVFGDIPQVKNK